ncbi:MAG: hypothetical protein WC855_13280 [Thermodesulfovibrionales bacterium]
MIDKEEEIILEDWSIVSFCSLPEIQKKYNLTITPFKKAEGRIAFRVHGDVESAINDIYSNRKVGINDYMKALRNVRGAIFTLRNLGRGQK